jgi:putative ABC transport system ATP-binding protein
MSDFIIKIEDLHKFYIDGDTKLNVLSGIDFSMTKSSSASIIGPSGSGKTTFLQIIAMIESPTHGKYYFNDVDISKIDETERNRLLKNEISIVYQQHNLLSSFNVIENINIASDKADKSFVDYILNGLGIYEKRYARPEELSGGQAQRASIARAICKKPKMILLDEPTGSLDEERSHSIMQFIENISQEIGSSFLLITHNTVLTKYTDFTCKITGGKLHPIN